MRSYEKSPASTGESLGKSTTNNIPQVSPNIKNPLKRLRIEKNLSPSQIIDKVQEQYPRFDISLYARCEVTELYGIELCGDAMQTLTETFAPEPLNTPKGDGHLLPCRVSCRLSAEEHAKLCEVMKAKGYDTMQAFIGVLLRGVVKRFYKAEEKGEGK